MGAECTTTYICDRCDKKTIYYSKNTKLKKWIRMELFPSETKYFCSFECALTYLHSINWKSSYEFIKIESVAK